MKVKYSFLSVVSLIAGLIIGCGTQNQKTQFVLVPKSISNPYWIQVEQGMKQAGKELDVNVKFMAPIQAADVTAQVNIVESLIAKGVSGIAISANDPDGVTSVINKAIAAGIPVITFDSDAPNSSRLAYIGTDNYKAGREAGKQFIKHQGPKGEYAIMTGGLGALNLNERIRGFRDELKAQNTELKELNLLACNEDPNQALIQIEDVTRAQAGLDGWLITGCWATVTQEASFLNALNHRRDMVVVSFDTEKEELLLVKAGLVQALVGQRPFENGKTCVEVLYDVVVNKKALEEEFLDTGLDVVTKENVEEFLARAR
jgi:ribose transport system substrate-binding protein